jgi:pimeloyl-ACP methyl ester carboxylesterase
MHILWAPLTFLNLNLLPALRRRVLTPKRHLHRRRRPKRHGSIAMAEDLESLRIYLGLEAFPVLLGHSNCAGISLAYPELYERVEKLILIGGQVLGYDNETNFKKFAAERAPLPQYKKVYETWGGGYPTTDAEFKTFLQGILPSYFVVPEKGMRGFDELMEGARCMFGT